MTDDIYSRRNEKLAAVLMKHFEIELLDAAKKHADDLLRSMSIAGALEDLDRSNTTPQKDQQHLSKAVQAMASVYENISKVGWHGQKTFADVLEPFLDENDNLFLKNSGARHLAKDALLNRLKFLLDGLKSASENVNLDGSPVTTALGEGIGYDNFRKSKVKKTRAKFLAMECAKVFFEQTGRAPTVSTRRVLNEAYGPYFDFVVDVFDACEIDAKAEGWARAACRDFSPSKK